MKTLHLLTILAVVGVSAFLLVNSCNKPEPSGIGELQKIVKKRELHLVQYKYRDMNFLHKKNDARKKVQMIVTYPVSVSAKVDLNRMQVDSIKKSIQLPNPTMDDPAIDFGRAEIKKVNDGFLLSFGGSRARILEILKAQVNESKDRIRNNASQLGILVQARDEAEDFVKDLLSYFNLEEYDVKFESPEEIDKSKGLEPNLAPWELESDTSFALINMHLIEINDELQAALDEATE